MESQYVRQVLTEFAETVKRAAKLNLFPGSLKESIDYDLTVYDSGVFQLEFIMNYYGIFQDQGVSGTRIKYLTKFSYSTRQPPTKDIRSWVAKKRIRFRDSGGRFTKANYDSIAYVIARSIKEKGLKPKHFFSKPFDKAFLDLDDEVVKAYGLEVDDALDAWLTDPALKNGQNIRLK